MKKLLSITLAIIMLLGMTVPAFAEGAQTSIHLKDHNTIPNSATVQAVLVNGPAGDVSTIPGVVDLGGGQYALNLSKGNANTVQWDSLDFASAISPSIPHFLINGIVHETCDKAHGNDKKFM